MTKSEKTRAFLLKHIDLFESNGGGANLTMGEPDFDLYARDYLEFAEEELAKNTAGSLINCISHLKRALDCQLDTFLHSFNLLKLFEQRNLKIDKKLEFLQAAGVFSPRSLSRFNSIRNRMEHDYQAPAISDIEVYFDLISTFVSLLETTRLTLSELAFFVPKDTYSAGYSLSRKEYGYADVVFEISYNLEPPCIRVNWLYLDEESEHIVVCARDEIQEFAFFLKVLILLSHLFVNANSISYAHTQLKKKSDMD